MAPNYPPVVLTDDEQIALARRGFIIGDGFAKGGFGIVYRGIFVDTSIAVKKIDLLKAKDNDLIAYVIMEMFILKKICHKNVVRLYDFFLVETQHLLIFMEFLDSADLAKLLKGNPLTEDKVAEIYWQFGSGLAYMHRRGFAHRDLKPGNILLHENNTVAKLVDFGFSMQCYNVETGKTIKTIEDAGTPYYVSPEVFYLISQHMSLIAGPPTPYCPFLADIWSMGIIVYEMLHGRYKRPFSISPESNSLERYKIAKNMAENLSFRTFNRPGLSDNVKLFVMRHLKLNPEERPTMNEVLKDNWIKAHIMIA